jgi:hypothetical protein
VRRSYVVSLAGCTAVTLAAFLPWLRIGDVGIQGVSDPAGYFVLGVGILGVLLSVVGMRSGRNTMQGVMLVGLAALTTLVVVWRSGSATVADRVQARAEAVALVDNVPVQPAPPVRVGSGLLLGLAGALSAAAAGLSATWNRS